MGSYNYQESIEFKIVGDYGLFTNPETKIGGEKTTYPVPTYEALKGLTKKIYSKPTFTWEIDAVRIMNEIKTTVKSQKQRVYNKKASKLVYYTVLENCYYQVRAHLIWNENQFELLGDRNLKKHINMALRHLENGGRMPVFLGESQFAGYVEPCVFGSGEGYYDHFGTHEFDLMYHGMTYPDEAYDEKTKNHLTANFWYPIFDNGVINFISPKECPIHKTIREQHMKVFNKKNSKYNEKYNE